MLVYNLNLIFTYIISLLSSMNVKYGKHNIYNFRILRFLVFIFLFFISAMRYMVGTDYEPYMLYFNNIKYYNIKNTPMEPGYYILNKLINIFTDESQYIFAITSFIILFLIFITINKYSKNFSISIYLFITLHFYYSSFNIVRQYIAIAIIFYSLRYIINRNIIKYIICVIISSLFHETAIIMIPMYFLLNIDVKRVYYILGIIITPVCINLIPKIIMIIFPSYSKYLVPSNMPLGAYFIISIVILVFGIIYKDKLIENNPINKIYINALFWGVVFIMMSSKYILFYRIAYYLYIYSILIVPEYLSILNKNIRICSHIGILVFFYFYSYIQLIANNGGVMPYRIMI